jgi:hypothetical protein
LGEQGRPFVGRVEVDAGQRVDLHLAQRGDRLAVGALDRGRLLGPGGEDDRSDVEARRPRRLERQQRVVDRAQAGRGGDDERQAERKREVAHQAAGRQRHEQAADALADQRVGVRRGRPRGGDQALRVDLLARQLRRQVRRHRRPVAVGRDLGVALRGAGGAAQQRMVWLPRLVEPGDGGLEHGDPLALRRERPRDRRRDDGLADLGPGPGHEPT